MEVLSRRILIHLQSAFGLPEPAAAGLVKTSRTALAEGMGQLARAVAEGEREGAIHWSHNLKGNLLNAGLGELAALAAAIEQESLAGRQGGGPVKERFAALSSALATFLAGE